MVTIVEKIFQSIEELIPLYMSNPADAAASKGVTAICIIDENGQVHGKMFGSDKLRCRDTVKVAWTKANQVWITGYKTLEYERFVFSNQIEYRQFGIIPPDFIGWEGGQPITLLDGTKLSIGFSGFRGISDTGIVLKALENAKIDIQ